MILFLDFDGVLHPDAAFLVKGRPTLKAEGQLFMWAPLLVDVLADFPEVQIVLSTSWRVSCHLAAPVAGCRITFAPVSLVRPGIAP